MSKGVSDQIAGKVVRRVLSGILGSLLGGKLGIIVIFGFMFMFVALTVVVTTEKILSYIPNIHLPCIVKCKDNNPAGISKIGKNEIPKQYMDYYQSAAAQFNVPWNLLAAMHRVETVFSTMDPMVSPVGAVGHMQFMPKTWIGWSYPGGSKLGDADIPDDILTDPSEIQKYGGYGMDADGDGRADPFDIADAIYTAAKYLQSNGGTPFNPEKALYAYNHDQKYVANVMDFANRYADGFTAIEGSEGTALPYTDISRSWMSTIEWTDPRTGEKKIGLDAELQAQAAERDIRIPNGLVVVLAEKNGRAKKEEHAKEYAELLQPRKLKVIAVKKSLTTTKTDNAGAVTEKTESGETLLFISEITTYRGKNTFKVGYDEQSNSTTDSETGSTVTSTSRVPVLAGTTLEKSDELLDAALKAAHVRSKKSKLEVLTMARLFDPNFYDERLMDTEDLIIFQNSEGQLQWPAPGYFTLSSPFGSRTDPVTGKTGAFHAGMDIPVPVGNPVVAAEDGDVEIASSSKQAGNNIRINHGNGILTRYLHLSKMYVKAGDRVKRGQVIGESGNTGKSTGPHLHVEVIINGENVDPYPYFSKKSGGTP
ncbi:peptidoglycan DD-metalloendopeptidase family protein [Cohnella sp. GCM10020058]|uniref:peptidoglycan DD-metalloendopeptidase family protein n=1 Tax=Cohnella sp. GCM10020058 TaxID=3317330 RepID=UPI003639EFB5